MGNKQTSWTQGYIDKAYDRIYLAIPKGGKQAIIDRAAEKGIGTIREYIISLILADMGRPLDDWERRAKSPVARE